MLGLKLRSLGKAGIAHYRGAYHMVSMQPYRIFYNQHYFASTNGLLASEIASWTIQTTTTSAQSRQDAKPPAFKRISELFTRNDEQLFRSSRQCPHIQAWCEHIRRVQLRLVPLWYGSTRMELSRNKSCPRPSISAGLGMALRAATIHKKL